ncbi:MAG: hypothetical protein C0403_15815, partial [Desulfobacterium sp.]|nr:hypothetical protein [Desulfobacterium sp.]
YGGIDAATRKNTRREQLIEAGLEAFGTIGFSRSKITDICRIAGLTERYFYESFQSKKDLLAAVYRTLIEETESNVQKILNRLDIAPIEAASETLKLFFEQFRNDPRRTRIQLFEILAAESKMAKQYRTAMHALSLRIEQIGEKIFRLDRSQSQVPILSRSMAGAIVEVARDWALGGYQTPVEELVSHLMEMVIVMGTHYQKKQSE